MHLIKTYLKKLFYFPLMICLGIEGDDGDTNDGNDNNDNPDPNEIEVTDGKADPNEFEIQTNNPTQPQEFEIQTNNPTQPQGFEVKSTQPKEFEVQTTQPKSQETETQNSNSAKSRSAAFRESMKVDVTSKPTGGSDDDEGTGFSHGEQGGHGSEGQKAIWTEKKKDDDLEK